MIRIFTLLLVLHYGAVAQKKVNVVIVNDRSDTLRGQLRFPFSCFQEKIRFWQNGTARSLHMQNGTINQMNVEGVGKFERMPPFVPREGINIFKREFEITPTALMKVAYQGSPLSVYEYIDDNERAYYYLLDSSGQKFDRVQFEKIECSEPGWEYLYLKAAYLPQMRLLAQREGVTLPQYLEWELAYKEKDIVRLVKYINKDTAGL